MAATIDNEATLRLHEHIIMLPFSFLKGLSLLLLQETNRVNLTSWNKTEIANDQCQTTVIVSEKISSTIPFFFHFPRPWRQGSSRNEHLATLRQYSKCRAPSAWHPPMEPREHSLRDAPVHTRAPLSSISQGNENNKKLYSALPTQEILSALMLTETLRGKSCHKPTRKTQLTVN